jgi:hypothetical protein
MPVPIERGVTVEGHLTYRLQGDRAYEVRLTRVAESAMPTRKPRTKKRTTRQPAA